MSGLDGLIKLAAVTAAIREIEREATGAGILQPGAAYALGALAEACGVQPGDTADDLATALVSKRVPPTQGTWLDEARAEGLDCRYRSADGTPDDEA